MISRRDLSFPPRVIRPRMGGVSGSSFVVEPSFRQRNRFGAVLQRSFPQSERVVIRVSLWNGVLCLVVLLVGYVHALLLVPDDFDIMPPEMLLLLQACLAGAWLACGAAPWWVRAGAFLAAYPYFQLVSQLESMGDTFVGFAGVLIVTTAITFRGVCFICRGWRQRKVARQQYSMLEMLLLVSFVFAACVVWGNTLVGWGQRFAEEFEWELLVFLAVFMSIVIVTALPAVFRTRPYRKWAMVVACVIVAAIPWVLLGSIWMFAEPFEQDAVTNVNLHTWLIAIITAATIYPLQAITNRDGAPFYPVFTPVDVPLEAVSPTPPTDVERKLNEADECEVLTASADFE